jgi:hypothetical protein
MTVTREQQAEKIICEIFQLGPGTNLERCLSENNLMHIKKWLTVTDAILEELQFTDPNVANKKLSLKLGDYHEFRVFCIMVHHRRAYGKPANYLGIDITADEFDDFDGSNECIKLMMAAQPMPTFAQPPPGNMSTTQTELVTFRKGIKRDASLFPVIKQDTEWDGWNRSIVSLARAQAIEQVLDSAYTPVLIDEISLF